MTVRCVRRRYQTLFNSVSFLGYQQRFELALFLWGNGCSPGLVRKYFVTRGLLRDLSAGIATLVIDRHPCCACVLTLYSLCSHSALALPPTLTLTLHTLPIAQLTVLSFSRRVLTLSLLTAIHLNSMLHGLTSPEKQDWRAQYR
jgi:hypothetical protein